MSAQFYLVILVNMPSKHSSCCFINSPKYNFSLIFLKYYIFMNFTIENSLLALYHLQYKVLNSLVEHIRLVMISSSRLSGFFLFFSFPKCTLASHNLEWLTIFEPITLSQLLHNFTLGLQCLYHYHLIQKIPTCL